MVVFRCSPGTVITMANQLKMADIQCIVTLQGRGWSRRRIARELGIDRETVARYVRLSALGQGMAVPNPANALAGNGATSVFFCI